MTQTNIPHFSVKNNFQKNEAKYEDILTSQVLGDISLRLTGQENFTVTFDNEGYNKGRLVVMDYSGLRTYISLAETDIKSRNSSFQSFPSAYSRFILDNSPKSEICYYILKETTGNIETDYFIFMYRLMRTAGVNLVNIGDHVKTQISAFGSPDDVILAKDKLRGGKGNKSTYVTKGPSGAVQVYAKTYGANKYESTLLCFALVNLTSEIELFEVEEGGLVALPQLSRDALKAMAHVSIKTSTAQIEIDEFKRNNSLRSIRFVFNILERFGRKKCVLCNCTIPQIVQGAHIWPVAAIKAREDLELREQVRHATDGNNGVWLCENHHKLFDSGLLYITSAGAVLYSNELEEGEVDYLNTITAHKTLEEVHLNGGFLFYLSERNSEVNASEYKAFGV